MISLLRTLIVFAFVLPAVCCAAQTAAPHFAAPAGTGEDYASPDGLFATHAAAPEFPQEGERMYSVAVNGRYVGLYTDKSHWGGLVHFGGFEFEDGRDVVIDITYSRRIITYDILPKTLDIRSVKRTSERSLRFKIAKADQNITLVVNNAPRVNVLHLFAASIDKNAPQDVAAAGYQKYPDRKLIYFGKGYYDLQELIGSRELCIPDGWTAYIAAGATVYGRIDAHNVGKETKLMGRGMVYNDDKYRQMLFTVGNSTGMHVEGVLFHGHRAQCWQVGVTRCHDVCFENVKIISTRYASTDGLDVINSQDCEFRNMFIRANDDAVAIKGLQDGEPAMCLPNKNLSFENMQLWNDCNCAFGMGAETHAAVYENISLRNSSILFSYDDPDHHVRLDERAALTICCLHGTYFKNILYENIDVYWCERLIAQGFKPDFWFGSLKGNQHTEGGISNVTFRNIQSHTSGGSIIANEIHLYGWNEHGTPPKKVENITFDNVRIRSHKIKSSADPHFRIGPNVSELHFE